MRIRGSQFVRGQLAAPRSKAYTHRALIASLLTEGETLIDIPLRCDDTASTLRGIQFLGARVSVKGDALTVAGQGVISKPQETIDCGESGATLRFLTAVSATSPHSVTLTGGSGLSKRPLFPLVEALKSLGASVRVEPAPSFRIKVQGPLKGGNATIPGNVSSQFISGLLFAAPLAEKDVTIRVNGQMESRPYVEMTLDVLKKHEVCVDQTSNRFVVRAPQEYYPTTHLVPGDFSSASFLLAAAATAGEMITVSGLDESSGDPDSVILDILSNIGARVEKNGHRVQVEKVAIESFEFDASDNPDLVPVLEILACNARGTSVIRGVERLRYKESNRLETIPEELRKMGANISFEEDRVVVEGRHKLVGQKLFSHGDHRVAMACTVASLTANGTSLVEGVETVSKSYPNFFEDLSNLGVRMDVE